MMADAGKPDLSRPRATARSLGEMAPDRHRFWDKHVLLTGESAVLHASNGRWCIDVALRLLLKTCQHITVVLPPECGGLTDELRTTAQKVAESGSEVSFKEPGHELDGFDAILSVGWKARPELPWTVINSDGWLARVSSGVTDLSPKCGMANPIAAMAAACLGTAEVFKRLIGLRKSRGPFFDGLSFSLDTYQCHSPNPGASLPMLPARDVTLFGAGAIGNGIVFLLRELGWTGRVDIVDRQDYGPENVGTCLLVGPSDVGQPKASWAAAILRPAVKAYGHAESIEAFKARLGAEIPYPSLILCGLDNIEARHFAQDLWPDIIIDGAIGPLECQVSRHPWGEDMACLRCMFQPPREDADQLAGRATGLPFDRMHEGESLLSEDDVHRAPPDKRAFLSKRVGRPMCSVVQESVAQMLSDQRLREGFEPSVPFVACLSAAMIVAELVKTAAAMQSTLRPAFRFDVLQGPASGQHLPMTRRRACQCVERANNINRWRRDRTG